VSQRVDFSANARIYDRRHGAALSLDSANDLASKGNLARDARVLDVGAGTGRVAITFAAIGYKVVALDPALPMLKELRGKAPDSQIQIVAGEGAQLPFAAGYFDAVILARVLYLMADWRKVLQQSYDVLKPGGWLFHEWGNGEADEAWVQIREKTRTLFEDAGVKNPFHPGARSESEIDDFLAGVGFHRSNELPVGPGPNMTLLQFLDRIMSGEVSYIWNVPKHVQESCLPQLKKWAENTFDLERSVPMPKELRWTIYRKP
jgi:ubiquinone/menaquinone biosynthesis C-methylase UbiE